MKFTIDSFKPNTPRFFEYLVCKDSGTQHLIDTLNKDYDGRVQFEQVYSTEDSKYESYCITASEIKDDNSRGEEFIIFSLRNEDGNYKFKAIFDHVRLLNLPHWTCKDILDKIQIAVIKSMVTNESLF